MGNKRDSISGGQADSNMPEPRASEDLPSQRHNLIRRLGMVRHFLNVLVAQRRFFRMSALTLLLLRTIRAHLVYANIVPSTKNLLFIDDYQRMFHPPHTNFGGATPEKEKCQAERRSIFTIFQVFG